MGVRTRQSDCLLMAGKKYAPLLLALAGIVLLVNYLANPLFALVSVVSALLLVLFMVRPGETLLFLLLIRSSLDITKDYFSIYISSNFQITATNAVSFLIIIGGFLYITGHRIPILNIPLAKLFLLFLMVSMLHFLMVENLVDSLLEFFRFLSSFTVYILVWSLFTTRRKISVLITVILLSSLIPVGGGLYQVILNRGQFITGFIRAYGTFVHPNPYAFYLIIILALTVNLLLGHSGRKTKVGLFALTVLGALCVLLSFTRTAWFGFLLIILFAVFFRERRLIWVLVALVLVFSFMAPLRSRFYDLSTSFNSLAHRLYIWKGGLSGLPRFPLLGRGLGSFIMLDVFKEPAHNDYLRVFFELGVCGLLVYLVLVGMLLIRLFSILRFPTSPYGYSLAWAAFSVGVIFLGASMISNILFRPVLQWYFWALMAAALKINQIEPSRV